MEKEVYLEGFDAKKIAQKDFENFSTLLGEQYKDVNTPLSVEEIRNSYTQENLLKDFENKYNSLVTPSTGYMYEKPVQTEVKPSLEQKNYNVDELYSTLSSGEKVANFPTYTPGIDNYEAFAQSQSNWDKWVNGGTKMLGQLATGVVGGTVGIIYGIGNGIKEGSFSATYDNDFMNYLDLFNERLKYTNPNYIKESEKDLTFGQKLGTANFWADEFLGGLSFTLSAVATEALWAWASGGSSLVTTGARLGVSKIDDVLRVASKAKSASITPLKTMTNNTLLNLNRGNRLARIGEGVNLLRSMYTGAGYEAGFEARSYMKEMRDKFEKDWLEQNGVRPSQEEKDKFEKELENSANGLFAYNLAIVGSSNLATFGSLTGVKLPKIGGSDWINKKIFGVGTTIDNLAIQATKGQKSLQYIYSLSKGAIVEGAFEEGMQSVGRNTAETLLKNGYDNKFSNESYTLTKAFGKSLAETYTTSKGLEEVYLGMLIGGLTGNALGVYKTGTLNSEFKDAKVRAEVIEREFGKGATYSSKVAVENMLMSNRVIASKKAEENADRKGDLLGGQIARNTTIFSQLIRANNLDFYDDTVKSTLNEIDLIDVQTLMNENNISEKQAEDLKESIKEEYKSQSERFKKVNDFSKYFVGNKLSKEEKQLVEDYYIKNGYSKEEANKVSSDVLSQALSYELFMGEVSYNFADEMLDAFQNEVQNLLGSNRIKSAFNINDVLSKSKSSTRRSLNNIKKELQKSVEESNKIEKEYRQVENIIAKTTSVEERQSIQEKLSDLMLKKEEFTKKIEDLTNKYSVLFNSSKLENPFGVNNTEDLILTEDITSLEGVIESVFNSIESLKNTDPQKAERLVKLFKEYEKSVVAFKRYSERTSNLTNPETGLRGKRNIISEILKQKTPKQSTIEMIQGLLDTHFEVKKVEKENINRLNDTIEDIKNQQPVVSMQPTTSDKISIKSYIIDQIKNHPYLYNQIGKNYSESLPTEEEIEEYSNLFEKDLVEQQPLTQEEKDRFNELNNKMANWELLEAVQGEGVSIANMIKQDILNSQKAPTIEIEEILEEDLDIIIKNGEVEENTPRPFDILQTVENVFVRKTKSGYYFSHLTPKKYFEIIGESGILEYQYFNEEGKPISKVQQTDVENVNNIVKPHTKIHYGNTSITITKGLNIKLPLSDFNNNIFKTRNTKSGYMMVFDTDGSAMKSDFKDVETYSPGEIYNLSSGQNLVIKADKNDIYNKQLDSTNLEDNLKLSLYDENGNKVADLKANYTSSEGQEADPMFLMIRNKAKQIYEASEEDLVEIGDLEVQNVFLGAPNLKLDENGREQLFPISTEQIYDYGIWSGGKTKLKNNLKGVRTDLLKGINKTLPIVVLKEGNTYIAYPVVLNKVDSNLGDTLLNSNISDAELSIQINEALLKAGKPSVELYYLSIDNQNMRNEDGTPTDTLKRAIEQVNSIQNKTDYKNTWFEDSHKKEQLKTEISININTEGIKFLSPKIAVNLNSFNEYTNRNILTEEQVTETINDYEKIKSEIGKYRLTFIEENLVRVGASSQFHPIEGNYKTIKHPLSGDVIFISNVGQKNKDLYNRLQQLNEVSLQEEIDKIKKQKLGNFAKTSEEMERYYSDLFKLTTLENQIKESPKLKKRLEQEKEKRFNKYIEAQNNKKC